MCKRYQEHQEEQKNILKEQIFKGNRTISDSSYSISSNDVAQFSYHNTEENFEMYGLDSEKNIPYSRLPMCVTDTHRKQQKQLPAPHNHL